MLDLTLDILARNKPSWFCFFSTLKYVCHVVGLDRTVAIGGPLVLSAAQSFDEDAPETNNLKYSWTCKSKTSLFDWLVCAATNTAVLSLALSLQSLAIYGTGGFSQWFCDSHTFFIWNFRRLYNRKCFEYHSVASLNSDNHQCQHTLLLSIG